MSDTLYVDWSYENNGNASANNYKTALYVDGVLKATWTRTAALEPGYYSYYEDFSLGSLNYGSHTIRLVVDYEDGVDESDEHDNEYEKMIFVDS